MPILDENKCTIKNVPLKLQNVDLFSKTRNNWLLHFFLPAKTCSKLKSIYEICPNSITPRSPSSQ